jgi:hypothetical protein
MRRKHGSAIVCLGVLLFLLAGSATALAAGESPYLPWGKYVGSVIGDDGGEAYSVTVWLTDNGDGTLRVQALTPLGVIDSEPVSPQQMGPTAFDLPVTVSWLSMADVTGSGTGQLRQIDGQWRLWGSGSGSASGSSGSGYGSATRVLPPSFADRAAGPVRAVGSGLFPEDPAPVPDRYPGGDFDSTTAELDETEADADVAPADLGTALATVFILIFMVALGIISDFAAAKALT